MIENQQTNLKFNFVTFESLPNYDPDQNYLKLMREISTGIIESIDTYEQINFIIELRRMRKYHTDLFDAVFSNLLPYFIENLMKNSKIEVCYNSLILVTEIFSFFRGGPINTWIEELLPISIKFSTSKFVIIQKQSLIALYNLANNMVFDCTLTVLHEIILENEELESENALETLLLFIKSNEENYLLNIIDWSDACEILSEMLENCDEKLFDRANIILYSLKSKYNSEFSVFLSFCTDEQRNLFEKSMNTYQFIEKNNKLEDLVKPLVLGL
jgi:hypothetical protein